MDRGVECISSGMVCNVYSEVSGAISKIPKTKENKQDLAQLQKTIKNLNSASIHKWAILCERVYCCVEDIVRI